MNVDFPDWLQSKMDEREWTQAELARRAGTTSTTIFRVIKGERKPGVDFCKGIARAFGMRDTDVMKIAGLAASTSPDDQTPSLRELTSKFSQLSDDDQETILKLVRALEETEQAHKRRGLKPRPKAG